MGTILSVLNKVKALDTGKVINDSIDETLPVIEELNRARMQEGIRSDGSVMPNYSFISVTEYGYPDGPIKLKDTGAFQAAIIAERQGEEIIQTSTDDKTNMLVEAYGEEIFGILGVKIFRNEYKDESLLPAIQERISQQTGLKFGK
jgi:hypothetical protein